MSELETLFLSYHKWTMRVLKAAALGLVLYVGYKYGYHRGISDAFDYISKALNDNGTSS